MADLVKRLAYFVNCTLLSRAKARSVKEKTLLPPKNHIFYGGILKVMSRFLEINHQQTINIIR